MALEGRSEVRSLAFDLAARKVTIVHQGAPERLLECLVPLKLGAEIAKSQSVGTEDQSSEEPLEAPADEAGVLKLLLSINGVMFLIEATLGWISQSTGLIADSLDMFADAAVYGLSLAAVGKVLAQKKRAARISGYLQMALALGAFVEVMRRFYFGSEPEPFWMMGVALVALAANVTCMWLLAKHRQGEVHMKASWIFSTNDVIANLGVVVAGGLVAFTGSRYPDLVIGLIISVVVLTGSLRILKVSRG
ncbi:MAG: cation transporter [Bdellovibrionales bacterium]|nr:cation transporter [Bdellovibrionales bacterium]